jgi:hypothetical protein
MKNFTAHDGLYLLDTIGLPMPDTVRGHRVKDIFSRHWDAHYSELKDLAKAAGVLYGNIPSIIERGQMAMFESFLARSNFENKLKSALTKNNVKSAEELLELTLNNLTELAITSLKQDWEYRPGMNQ